MIRGMALLLLLQLAGEAISLFLRLPIPGNVIGSGLLLALLAAGVIRLEWVQEAADLLLSHFALFFIPAGVGVMLYFDLVRREWLPLLAATVVSSLAVMAVTGWTERWLEGGGGADGE